MSGAHLVAGGGWGNPRASQLQDGDLRAQDSFPGPFFEEHGVGGGTRGSLGAFPTTRV